MSNLEQAARLALELCDRIIDGERIWSLSDMREVSTALREALSQQAEPGMDADAWLRQRYGGYKAHPEWRALAEAFNAGRKCKQQAEPVGQAIGGGKVVDHRNQAENKIGEPVVEQMNINQGESK